jgi:hypothetical protein
MKTTIDSKSKNYFKIAIIFLIVYYMLNSYKDFKMGIADGLSNVNQHSTNK